MDFAKVVADRRSIRSFETDRKVPKKTLEKIIKHATLAPSSKNRQPWYFVVIQDDIQTKNKIADIMIETLGEMQKKDSDFPAGSVKATADIIKNAPCFIAVFDTYNIIPNSMRQSIGACIENMCLSATNYKVGSLWICDIDICFDKIKSLLEIKEPYSLVAGVALGYPLINPAPRPRKPINEVCKFR